MVAGVDRLIVVFSLLMASAAYAVEEPLTFDPNIEINDISRATSLDAVSEAGRLYSTVINPVKSNAFCIINSRVYRLNDKVENFTIIDIMREGISVEKNGIEYYIPVSGYLPN